MSLTESDVKINKSIDDDSLLFDLVKEICSENHLSRSVAGKVNRILADCDLNHHTSLHKLSTADERTSTLLGLMQQPTSELSFDEQAELNHAIIQKIQNKIPKLTAELEHITRGKVGGGLRKSKSDQIKELQESLDEKLNLLEERENEKVNLMMEWLDHRLQDVTQFSDNSSHLLTLKTRILQLKSKILYLQILQNIFTETNQSIKSYSELHRDLTQSIRDSEKRIQEYEDIINHDIDN